MQLTPHKIISLISWLFLVVTSLVSFYNPIKLTILFDVKMFWLSVSAEEYLNQSVAYLPAGMHYGLFYFCFVLLIILILSSFCAILFYLFKDEQNINPLFEGISKFHFIPVICASVLYIIGEANDLSDIPDDAYFIFNLIFIIIGLGSLIFIHYKTSLSAKIPYYIIKQATYGCLIALLVYNFFFTIWFYGVANRVKSADKIFGSDGIIEFSKNCYITFSIFIGLVNLGLAFFLKNMMIGIMNLFIYIEMIVWFFRFSKEERDNVYNGAAEGVIDIIMLVINLAVLSFMFIKYRAQIMQTA